MGPLTRRELLVATLASACAPARGPGDVGQDQRFTAIEARVGGRLGVFALDSGSGRTLAHRADERFAMCSTFKWILAAAVLSRVDRGQLSLDVSLPYQEADLLDHSPITKEHVAEGAMTVEKLAQAAVITSDNAAANILLAKIDGPARLTSFIREHGDGVTRLDRNEPSLNENVPNDPRDTTTPRAMANLMRTVLCGDALSPASRERLTGWLRDCTTGKERLRAGLPRDWVAGDKTGTGGRGSVNDVAIAWPPGRAPVLVAVYLSDSDSNLATLNAAHAEVGRIVARGF